MAIATTCTRRADSKAARERVDFIVAVVLDPADFRTVSDFRKRDLKALAGCCDPRKFLQMKLESDPM